MVKWILIIFLIEETPFEKKMNELVFVFEKNFTLLSLKTEF